MNKNETTEESKLTADFLFDENQTYHNDATTWRIVVQDDKVEFLLISIDKIFKVNKSFPVNEQLMFDKIYKGLNVPSGYGNSTITNTRAGNTTAAPNTSTAMILPPTPNYVTVAPLSLPSQWTVMGQTPPVPNVIPNKISTITKISNKVKKLLMSGGKP